MTNQQYIRLLQLRTGYTQGKQIRVISESISEEIRPGEVVMLMGPNGSGKSTLLHSIAGLLPPLSGQIFVHGEEISRLGAEKRSRLLSLVLTDKIWSQNLTVYDIVLIGRYPYTNAMGTISQQDREIIGQAIGRCRLEGMEHRRYANLSDGEKQRVMIARALAQETPLMLLDEPTAHLDFPSRMEIIMMLRQLAAHSGKAILISTHELELALNWGDKIWLIDRLGKLHSGTPEDLILSGEIERVFGNEQMVFHPEEGYFSVKQSLSTPIGLSGEGLRRIWVERAIRRLGYQPAPIPQELNIYTEEKGWRVEYQGNSQFFASVLKLLDYLKENIPRTI